MLNPPGAHMPNDIFDKPHRAFGVPFLLLTLVFLGEANAVWAQPQEVSDSNVSSCRFLNQVEGSSEYGKHPDWRVLAKHSALAKADKLGASHVVWGKLMPVGAFNGIATARAYRCKP